MVGLTILGVFTGLAQACQSNLTQQTLAHYDAHAKTYLEKHQHSSDRIRGLYRTFLTLLPPTERQEDLVVIDLGSGHGRETKEFRRDEIDVIPVEPSAEMAKITEQQSGVPVWRQTAQTLNVGRKVHGIWAMASFIHVPDAELPLAFERLKAHLEAGGGAFISVITGVGTPDVGEVAAGRFFNRVSERRLREIAAQVGGFEILEEHTGTQRDDYHAADRKPSQDFGFFNLFLRRV